MLRRPERYVLLFEVVVDFRVVPDELGEGFDDNQLYGRDAYSFVRMKSVLLGHRGGTLTVGSTSYSGSAPIAPLPMAIFESFTGGFGVEKIVFVMYG